LNLPHFGIRTAVLRHGSRTVLLTQWSQRLGNYLYFALHAFLEAQAGNDYRVLDSGLDPDWYECFPGLANYTTQKVRWFDKREHVPELFYQGYGSDFTPEDLTAFITTVLTPKLDPSPDRDTVTVNVRHGDYYASPEAIAKWGFDVSAYLRTALSLAEAKAPVEAVRLVSDDSDWAAGKLHEARPDLSVTEVVPGPPPNQLFALARSRRLILPNSTFSFWAAYMSELLHAPDEVEIYVPAMHARGVNDGRPWQHAPSWKAIPTRPAPDA